MDKKTLDKINGMTRRSFRAEELYTFPVTLCGNEVDRDGERFSNDALETLQTLFIGKTFIADHKPTMENQIARVYDTELVTTDELTSYGEPYKYLKGYVYMVRTEKNADLITEIDAGIKREVSVGCSATVKRCSICGKDILETPCEHIRGKEYEGKSCHYVLENVTDAYELSFVAVPAQAEAGVTKKSFEGVKKMEFTPIETQEALDAILAEHDKQYSGWLSPEQVQASTDKLTAQVNDLTKKLNTAQANADSQSLANLKMKIAHEKGIPFELAERLNGTTEDEIKQDAEMLATFTAQKRIPPTFRSGDGKLSGNASLVELLHGLKNN